MEEEMDENEIIDEIIADLIAGGVDLDDFNELDAYLDHLGLDAEEKEELLQAINEHQSDTDMLTNDFITDAAQDMADEDNSEVSVTEEDSDGDGDNDSVSIEKEDPEDDSSDLGNSSEDDDEPHDEENSTNSIARQLSEHKYW